MSFFYRLAELNFENPPMHMPPPMNQAAFAHGGGSSTFAAASDFDRGGHRQNREQRQGEDRSRSSTEIDEMVKNVTRNLQSRIRGNEVMNGSGWKVTNI